MPSLIMSAENADCKLCM